MSLIAKIALFLVCIPCCAIGEDNQATFAREHSPEGQKALLLLLKAKSFSIGPVGIGGDSSDNELALRTLVKESRALDSCNALIKSGTPEGQLYGLYGLYFLDRDKFKVESKKFEKTKLKVFVEMGCTGFDSEFVSVLKQIQDGVYDKAFSKKPPPGEAFFPPSPLRY